MFITKELNRNISFGFLYDLFNYEEGSEEEKLYKAAFLKFYRWYTKDRYAIHVLQEGKILDKQLYLREKNFMVYLPHLTEKAQKKLQGKGSYYIEKRNKNSYSHQEGAMTE